ncbi:unnamed protein product [marine sediment metagenome]|uniref:Uncharacterized protein n=1 Tax=marine sediment metagenome TaxID=412755 RepID=X0RY51_9ZZZZ
MNKYTVRSFEKMQHYPDTNLSLVDEAYFDTMDECEKWCEEHLDIKWLNFEIHHSLGANNYRHGIASGMGIITWLDKDYIVTFPSVRPWWSIYDVPPEVDEMCRKVNF